MGGIAQQEKRFATFVIDSGTCIEFAISAEDVFEATAVIGTIQPFPTGVPYLEGLMHLRDDAIPVINVKKRLGLPLADYPANAKVAVVNIAHLRVGLLFDDIKDVLIVDGNTIEPLHPALQTGEGIISDLIRIVKEHRTLQLLDLNRLLGSSSVKRMIEANQSLNPIKTIVQQTYSRFVVFTSDGQVYGVPVSQVQEITFLSKIDDIFKNDFIEGAVQLRGQSIPVLHAARLLQNKSDWLEADEDTRVLVLSTDTFQYGLIVDNVREILSIPDQAIMPLPRDGNDAVSGIYQQSDGKNIMLLQVHKLIETKQRELSGVALLKSASREEQIDPDPSHSRHLITSDSYLVFSVGRNFAIKLKDVQEIIESKDIMELPAATGFDRRLLNLRGVIVPVINLRAFYNFPEDNTIPDGKLIITRSRSRILALEVDRILTIYKQVQYRDTPSLHPQLSDKKDTLNRLIEFTKKSGANEHVLVVNIEAMMDNHLGMSQSKNAMVPSMDAKESDHVNHNTTAQ